MSLEVKIRGTWRKVEQGYSITQQAGAVATTKLNIKMESGDDAIETLDRVDVYLDIAGTDYLIFTGVVKTVDTPVWSTTYEAEVYPVHVVSVDTVFNYRRVSRSWYNKTYSEIVTDLYNDYLDEEGITLGTVSTTATAIRKYSAQDKKIGEILDDIAEKVGWCSYYLTPAKVFHFILSTEFPSVTAPTHLTELKRSSDYADLRTIQKVRGASTRITGTATNDALITDIATRSGLSGKIEHLITNSDIHNPTDAATEATAQLANYAEDEEVITCVCHDIDASELYNEWTLNYPDLGIVGYYVVVERTITHFVDDQVTIRVKLQNRNFFARTGWSLKKALVASSDANTSVGDSYNEDALTPSEKITTRRQWYATVEEKTLLDSQADAYSVSRVAYDAAFQALADYLNDGSAWSTGLPSWIDADNISVITEIDDDEYIETWNDYFIARDTLRHNIEDAIEAAAEAAEMRVFASVALLEAATGVRDEEVVTCLGEFYKWDATNSKWDKMTGTVLPLPTLQISPRFVPGIPDSPAGTTYRNTPGWTTGVDGWTRGATTTTVSVEGERLKAVETTSIAVGAFRSGMGAISAKQVTYRVTSQYKIQTARYWNGTAMITMSGIIRISDYEWIVSEVITSSSTPTFYIYTTEAANLIWFDYIYIGTGAYLTPAPDESGSGNHLANTGVIPGEEDGRKVLLFNGQNSTLYSSVPLTGAVFSVVIEWKRTAASIGIATILVGDRDATSGWYLGFDTSNVPRFYYYVSGTGWTSIALGSAVTSTTEAFVYGVHADGTSLYGTYKGVKSTGTAGVVVPSAGIFELGYDTVSTAYSGGKLFGLYLTDKVLTQDEITWFVANGLPEPRYTYENYLLDKAADDGSMSPADKASELTDWMEHWYEDERNTALPTTFASITTAGKYKETATIANTAGIWTPTTASTAAKTYYDASEAYRAVLFNYSTAGTGFLLRVNRDTATDISALSPTLNALRTALAAAETALRDEALRILTRKLNISGATSYGYEGGATVPDPTNLVLTAAATGFTPTTYKWQYYDSGWSDLANDSGKVAGVATSELTIYYNATPWGTARYLRVRCLADSEVYQEVTLTKIYDGVDGTSITLEGSVDEPADLADIVDPDVGDLYTCLAGGTYGGVTYTAGDGAAWDGSAWFNAGPIQGPAGTDGASSYLHIKFSAVSDGTGFSDTTNKYIGRAVTTSATAPTDKADYTWTKWIGDDATSYWLYLSPEVVTQAVAGGYTPSTITAYAMSQTGSSTPWAYSGRFKVATYDGSTYTDVYTSTGDFSSLALDSSYWSGAVSIRFRLYKAGGTTTLLNEKTCQIVQDGSDAGRYLGRYHAGHPASHNNFDRWTVYDAPSGYTTQPGIYYDDLGTVTRITVAADPEVRCYMAEAIEDVSWAESQGTYGDSEDYGMETIFQAVFAVTVACQTLAASSAFIAQLKSSLVTTDRLVVGTNVYAEKLDDLSDDMGVIVAGELQSTDWDTTHGMQIDLTNRTIKIGGSTTPKFSVAATGVLSATDVELTGTLTADDGLVGVAGSLRTKVDAGRVYFYRSNGTSWALMASMRGFLDGTYNGVNLSGGTDSDPCHIFTSGGSLGTSGGNLNTSGGALFSGGGDVKTEGGDVETDGGVVYTYSGNIYAVTGNIYTTSGYMSAGGKITAGTYITAGSYISADNDIISTGGSFYSRSTAVTSTSFANWFAPSAQESGFIFHNDGAYSGVSWYSRDDAVLVTHIAGDAGYVQASGSYIQIKAARSGVSHTFRSVRHV